MVSLSVYTTSDGGSEIGGTPFGAEIWFRYENRVWFHFPNVTIPAGSVILSASFRYYMNGYNTTSKSFNLYFEDADNPSAIISELDCDSRTKTTAYGLNSVTSSGGYGYKTRNVPVEIVQEVIDRPGWSSGNAMNLIGVCTEASAPWISVAGTESGLTARLDISYMPPIAGGGAQIIGLELL